MIKKLFLLAFVALAVGMAVPSTRAEIQARTLTPIRDYIGNWRAPGRLEAMADQLDARLGRGEGIPGAFDGWLRRDYAGREIDPWGNPWFIRTGRRDYTVGSTGPDGEQGTEDDIIVTRRLPSR